MNYMQFKPSSKLLIDSWYYSRIIILREIIIVSASLNTYFAIYHNKKICNAREGRLVLHSKINVNSLLTYSL